MVKYMTARYRYRYVKAPPARPLTVVLADNKTSVVSSVLMFTGIAIISWVAWPIVSFKLLVAPQFAQLIAPMPEEKVKQVLNQATADLGKIAVGTVQTAQAQVVDNTTVDYSKASNWFPQLAQEDTSQTGNSYKISIPKLAIENANAIVGGEDLSESLIHFGGTALPGEYGNAVIFGHSTLPYFYNPENYTTIFSTLTKMEKGDKVLVERDGLRYTFVVEEMFIVAPKDIQILEQRFDDSYVTLVTCVPPGTYLERLVVRARLQKL